MSLGVPCPLPVCYAQRSRVCPAPPPRRQSRTAQLTASADGVSRRGGDCGAPSPPYHPSEGKVAIAHHIAVTSHTPTTRRRRRVAAELPRRPAAPSAERSVPPVPVSVSWMRRIALRTVISPLLFPPLSSADQSGTEF